MSRVHIPTPYQVAKLRARMGWSQIQMAKRLHLKSATMISRFECGVSTMSPANWELLCIKAQDEWIKVSHRQEEIQRRQGSVTFINKIIDGTEKRISGQVQ